MSVTLCVVNWHMACSCAGVGGVDIEGASRRCLAWQLPHCRNFLVPGWSWKSGSSRLSGQSQPDALSRFRAEEKQEFIKAKKKQTELNFRRVLVAECSTRSFAFCVILQDVGQIGKQVEGMSHKPKQVKSTVSRSTWLSEIDTKNSFL